MLLAVVVVVAPHDHRHSHLHRRGCGPGGWGTDPDAATKTNFLPSVMRPQTLGRSADDSIAADIAIGAAATTADEVTVGLVTTISVDVCNVSEAAL